MAKTKVDIHIGQRMREEIDRIFPTGAAATKALRCDRKNYSAWNNGETPNAIYLARLHYFGGDVIYVLTGKRRK